MKRLTSNAIEVCWARRAAAGTFEERCAWHERGMRVLKRYWARLPEDTDSAYEGHCDAMEAARAGD